MAISQNIAGSVRSAAVCVTTAKSGCRSRRGRSPYRNLDPTGNSVTARHVLGSCSSRLLAINRPTRLCSELATHAILSNRGDEQPRPPGGSSSAYSQEYTQASLAADGCYDGLPGRLRAQDLVEVAVIHGLGEVLLERVQIAEVGHEAGETSVFEASTTPTMKECPCAPTHRRGTAAAGSRCEAAKVNACRSGTDRRH